ncbi:MAG: glycosyltransferase family 4 protein, partial [Thermotogae bacterium]|nr:glycosyltransferase family 4 protein [Thermotogota bacterium]
SETFGIVVVEAMACGTTVVVSSEIPEEAAPDDLCYRVGLNSESVRMGIEKALKNPIPPRKLMKHARSFSDVQRFIDGHLKVYTSVL